MLNPVAEVCGITVQEIVGRFDVLVGKGGPRLRVTPAAVLARRVAALVLWRQGAKHRELAAVLDVREPEDLLEQATYDEQAIALAEILKTDTTVTPRMNRRRVRFPG